MHVHPVIAFRGRIWKGILGEKTHLPASVAGNTRYNQTETGGTSSPRKAVGLVGFAAGTSLFGELNNNAEGRNIGVTEQ